MPHCRFGDFLNISTSEILFAAISPCSCFDLWYFHWSLSTPYFTLMYPCSYIFLEWIWYYLCSCLHFMFGRSLDSVSTSKTMRCSFSPIVFRSVLFLKIQLMPETFVLSLIHNLHDDFQLPVIIQPPISRYVRLKGGRIRVLKTGRIRDWW